VASEVLYYHFIEFKKVLFLNVIFSFMSKFIWHDFKEGHHARCMFFGIIDIIVGILIFLSPQTLIAKDIFIYLSFLYFILGFSSLIKSFYNKYFFDWRGYFDVIIAFILLSIFYGNVTDFFRILGIVVMLKGFLCCLIPTTKEY